MPHARSMYTNSGIKKDLKQRTSKNSMAHSSLISPSSESTSLIKLRDLNVQNSRKEKELNSSEKLPLKAISKNVGHVSIISEKAHSNVLQNDKGSVSQTAKIQSILEDSVDLDVMIEEALGLGDDDVADDDLPAGAIHLADEKLKASSKAQLKKDLIDALPERQLTENELEMYYRSVEKANTKGHDPKRKNPWKVSVSEIERRKRAKAIRTALGRDRISSFKCSMKNTRLDKRGALYSKPPIVKSSVDEDIDWVALRQKGERDCQAKLLDISANPCRE